MKRRFIKGIMKLPMCTLYVLKWVASFLIKLKMCLPFYFITSIIKKEY